jgi:hypothetical protein
VTHQIPENECKKAELHDTIHQVWDSFYHYLFL